MIDFTTLDYLNSGSPIQRQVFDLLMRHKIFERLSQFTPILAGTFPIDIAIENSDLDVLCCWKNRQEFVDCLHREFGTAMGFDLRQTTIGAHPTVIANLTIDSFDFEVFGQCVPVTEQNAYRHLIIEHAILEKRGVAFKNEIIRLKKSGIKTEPAFAQLLGLSGDSYEALLNYQLNDEP